MRDAFWIPLLALALLAAGACARSRGPDLLRSHPAVNADLTINVVIENPAGTDEKWEVRLPEGRMVREKTGEAFRTIPYLPHPANGGMIPRTLLDPEHGGDGEPLDVLVLGPSVERGRVVRAVVIGSLRVLDRLERDDKILAVVPGTPLGDVADVYALEERFPGVLEILETWYANYVGGEFIQVQGVGSRAAARELIAVSAEAFERSVSGDPGP